MKIGTADTSKRVVIVAEIGNNHEGSFDLAQEMIVKAASAGVDAVKFQTFLPEHYVSCDQTERLTRLRKFALTFGQFEELAGFARKQGVAFFSTPFDLASADALAEFCPVIKVSSGDNVFFPLLERIAATRKPVILSTGLADHGDIDASVRILTSAWDACGHEGALALLHCVSSYPTPPEAANLSAIRAIAQRFPAATIGYSDHTLGTEAAVLSVALGARIIEKHFTLRKDLSDFRDHQLSSDPDEMAELVRRIRLAELYLGEGQQTSQIEEGNRQAMRRSIAASRALPAGVVLGPDDITWVRPGGGFAPGQEGLVIGRALTRDVVLGQVFLPDDVGAADPGADLARRLQTSSR